MRMCTCVYQYPSPLFICSIGWIHTGKELDYALEGILPFVFPEDILVCVCVWVCECVGMCLHLHECIYTSIGMTCVISICAYIYVCVCVCVCVHKMHLHLFIYICMYVLSHSSCRIPGQSLCYTLSC
jgi:hypothetical protein